MALIIQLLIAGFSGLLVVGLVAAYDPGADATQIGVAGDSTDVVLEQLEGESGLQHVEYDDAQHVSTAVDTGEIDAGLIVTERDDERTDIVIVVPNEDLVATLILTQLQDVMGDIENEQRQQATTEMDVEVLDIPTEHQPNPYFTFTYTVLIPLLVFLPVFISGSVAVDSLTEEIERGTLPLLQSSPASLTGILDAKAVVATILAPAQAALWFLLLGVNDIAIEHVGWLLAYTVGVALLTVAVGIGIALVFRTRQYAQLVYAAAIVASFALLSAIPQSPANVVARLATGSASGQTLLIVCGTVIVGFVIYATVRRVAPKRFTTV